MKIRKIAKRAQEASRRWQMMFEGFYDCWYFAPYEDAYDCGLGHWTDNTYCDHGVPYASACEECGDYEDDR